MLNRGVAPKRINYVIPQRQFDVEDKFKNNTDRLKYEDKRVNDPEPFNDPNIEEMIFTMM